MLTNHEINSFSYAGLKIVFFSAGPLGPLFSIIAGPTEEQRAWLQLGYSNFSDAHSSYYLYLC